MSLVELCDPQNPWTAPIATILVGFIAALITWVFKGE